MAESDLIRGNVDTVILKVLFEGDRYGYDLIKQINARSGGQWEIRQATLYASLKRLEKQEFISSYWDSAETESGGGRRKYYTLTDRGREVFVTYKNEWERSRDLFGELIEGSEPILPTDDFSDVEDETYDIPKRKAKRKPKKETAPAPQEQNAEVNNYAEPEAQAEEPAEEVEDEQSEQTAPDYQSSLFDLIQSTESLYSSTTVENPTQEPEQETSHEESPVYATDPHELIERMYEQERSGESYAAARGRFYDEHDPDINKPIAQEEPRKAPPAPAPAPSEPAPVPTVTQEPPTEQRPVVFQTLPTAPTQRSHELTPVQSHLPEEESAARLAYKEIFSDLVSRFDSAQQEARAAEQEQAAAEEPEELEEDEIRIRRFSGVEQAAAELGNAIDIREHNDSAKQYAREYYYYSNKLMMTQYTITCLAMFVVGLILFLTFYTALGMRMRYDFALYIAAGLFPIILFIFAVIVFAGNPEKKKRINLNFRVSMIVRIVIMIQVAVVVYCLNLIWGMPVAFSVHYVPSLVIPIAYALFIPINKIIFVSLLNSRRYALD